MSTTRTKPSAPAARRRPAPAPPKRPPWLWITLGVVVALAAVVAIVASGGSNAPTGTAGIEETRAVEVTGTSLAPLGSGPDPAVGQLAPVARGASFDGTPVTIGGDGTPRVIAFVAHWCPHCQREVPLLSAYLGDDPMPEGVDLVTVATSTGADRPNYPPSAWLAREEWPGPVLADSADGTTAQAFGLTAFPYFVAVNAAGDVMARTSGEISTAQFAQLVSSASTTSSS
jgi:thiol-disulfide isomerase/thioredoxin